MKWKRHKLTFMVIPDANSQVIRFRLSPIAILAALLFIVMLTAAAVTLFFMYGNRSSEVDRLQLKLSASTGAYEKIVSDKDRHIDDLQTEIAGLSEQAKTIQDKMADIRKLESELKEIAGMEPGVAPADTAVAASGEEGYAMDGEGTGGEDLPVSEDAIDDLVKEASDDFRDIGEWIADMKPRLEETKDAVIARQKLLRVTPTIWPTDNRKITSEFGVRRDPFTHRARFHAGIDISGDTGDPVYATADGTVVHAGKDGSHGNNVLISHGNGIRTHYSHLSKISIAEGAKVKKGDVIGVMGSTGRSTGPHLHYEVLVNGTNIDPQPYLRASRKDN